MLKNPRVLLLVALLVVSVATLIQFIVDDTNRVAYGIATTVAHAALVAVGSTFARSAFNKRPSSPNTDLPRSGDLP